MCLFSLPIRHVSKTRIFARPLREGTATAGDRQFLAYSMSLDADGELAMVLPLPVPKGCREDAVVFRDMSGAKNFFDLLDAMFPMDLSRFEQQHGTLGARSRQALLEVHAVGDFEASFVPSREDFSRLDPRFQLSSDVWDALPQYADWGFCVFKLHARDPHEGDSERGHGRGDERGGDGHDEEGGLLSKIRKVFRRRPAPRPAATREYHPMAFEFPRRDPSQLFFPTVHVHDGKVHETAHFDHSLYCQVDTTLMVAPAKAKSGDPDWEPSINPLGNGLPPEVVAFLERGAKAFRLQMKGDFANRDVVV